MTTLEEIQTSLDANYSYWTNQAKMFIGLSRDSFNRSNPYIKKHGSFHMENARAALQNRRDRKYLITAIGC